ncbi:hypothetical protein BVRB_3g053150 [Beta vulgaris subsp. vulgaris]|nr:hypothetical protein BVRB_3g053150 [Beta vulgaris subsp. vulgaris]
MAKDKVVDESELRRLREELQGFIKRTNCVAKELQDQASNIKKLLEVLRSKCVELSKIFGIEAEISKMSRIETEISRINTEISNKKAEISKINVDISNKKADISKIQQLLSDDFASVEAKIGVNAQMRLFPLQFYERHFVKSLRLDARPLSSARDTTISLGAVSSANGSALVKVGCTDICCLDVDGALYDAALLSAVAAFSNYLQYISQLCP